MLEGQIAHQAQITDAFAQKAGSGLPIS